MIQPEATGEPQYIELNRIQLGYVGILAEKMEWLRPQLVAFEEASDLRTTVAIRNDDAQERIEVAQLGDTMAFKKIAQVGELFKKSESTRFSEVSTNLATGRAEIVIFDQEIAKVQQAEGRFDQEKFIQEVDRSSRQGLEEILKEEKKRMTELTLRLYATIAPLFAIALSELAILGKTVVDVSTTHVYSLQSLLGNLGIIAAWFYLGKLYMDRIIEKVAHKMLGRFFSTDRRYWPFGMGEISIKDIEKGEIETPPDINPFYPSAKLLSGRKLLRSSRIIEPK